MIIKKCTKRHLIYNICFIKPLLLKIYFNSFFQSLIFLFLRGNQLHPKVVQALAVFQTRVNKAINNLVWPENWSCFKQEGGQKISSSVFQPDALTYILYKWHCFFFYWEKVIKSNIHYCCVGQTAIHWIKFIIWNKVWLWRRQCFNHTFKEIIIHLQYKWKCLSLEEKW